MTMAQITARVDGFYKVIEPNGTQKDRCRIELRLTDEGRIELVFVEQPHGPLPKVDWPTIQEWLAPWYERGDILDALETADEDDQDWGEFAKELDDMGWKLVPK